MREYRDFPPWKGEYSTGRFSSLNGRVAGDFPPLMGEYQEIVRWRAVKDLPMFYNWHSSWALHLGVRTPGVAYTYIWDSPAYKATLGSSNSLLPCTQVHQKSFYLKNTRTIRFFRKMLRIIQPNKKLPCGAFTKESQIPCVGNTGESHEEKKCQHSPVYTHFSHLGANIYSFMCESKAFHSQV